MHGLMMEVPLTITSIMRHAERHHPKREIVSVTPEQPRHRYTYADAFARARRLANALKRLGLKDGDRVATLAWNDYRHFEIYYAVSCSGFVCHTINPRLFEDQIVYIVNHAEDKWFFVDPAFVPLLEKLQSRFESVAGYVVLCDDAHMPATQLPNAHCYEALPAAESDDFDWPQLDERTASSLCYTSGTTGNPKGVLYDHRSTVLHAFASALPDVMDLSSGDVVMPIVPMFHANAWGMPYSTVLAGAKLVFPGGKMGDAATIHALVTEEQVNFSGGVPTVWLAVVAYLDQTGESIAPLTRVVCGGAAPPLKLIQDLERHGVALSVAWGMTEMSPLGTYNTPKPETADLTGGDRDRVRIKAGRAVYGVELKITDDENRELPWDDVAFGALKVRGPWVCRGYFKTDRNDVHQADGWFDTGDVASIDPEGYMRITDRTKDVIKSGGEWISSIDLENAAMAHPGVAEAAAIGLPHPKWSERPLLIVVSKPKADISKEELREFLTDKVAKWWLPDDIEFVDELPHTATGKISKLTLRQRFADYQWGGSDA